MDAFHDILFLIGVVLMSVSAFGALIALVVFRISGQRLHRTLESEFGKKHR